MQPEKKDQEQLREIILSDAPDEIREKAAAELTDQDIIRELVVSRKLKNRDNIRLTLTLLLNDTETLCCLARQDRYTGVRIAAVSRLQGRDQNLCREIAADLSLDPLLRAEAVSGIKDRELLRSYMEDDEWEVNLAALIAIDDQYLFRAIAWDQNAWSLFREEVTAHISNEDTLFDLAMNYTQACIGDADLARIATENIKDTEHLMEIAADAADSAAAATAMKRLRDAGLWPEKWLKKGTEDMFDLSFEGYLDWIEKLRVDVREDPSERNITILARVLCDCIAQSGRENAEKHGLLWEAIYWCLHLYYVYGKKEFLVWAESIDRYKGYGPGNSEQKS